MGLHPWARKFLVWDAGPLGRGSENLEGAEDFAKLCKNLIEIFSNTNTHFYPIFPYYV